MSPLRAGSRPNTDQTHAPENRECMASDCSGSTANLPNKPATKSHFPPSGRTVEATCPFRPPQGASCYKTGIMPKSCLLFGWLIRPLSRRRMGLTLAQNAILLQHPQMVAIDVEESWKSMSPCRIGGSSSLRRSNRHAIVPLVTFKSWLLQRHLTSSFLGPYLENRDRIVRLQQTNTLFLLRVSRSLTLLVRKAPRILARSSSLIDGATAPTTEGFSLANPTVPVREYNLR